MKAIVSDKYGSPDDLKLQEIDMPVIGDDGVLVRVQAASVNPYDWHVMRGSPFIVRLAEGLRRPKQRVRGVDVAGRVESVGKNVTQFQPGNEVFGGRTGAFAEYVGGTERNFVLKPSGLSFEQAAAIPIAGCTALQGLRDRGRLQPGQRVLINGAAGGVGTFAVQIAKALGAEVTGVCSTRNLDLVRSIGADEVVDYTAEDFTRRGQQYDVILEAFGNRSLSDLRRALTPNGTLVLAAGSFTSLIGALVLSRVGRQRMLPFLATLSKKDLVTLKELIEAGRVTPVVDRTYPLSEAPEAIRYLETKHARGKVIITM
ncbi:MAG TPA: NAD(P)-dependent alcohol dehydrogenase [bacterium]|jgi:NADPH:quinone reductase-like Zn-dependent oxidoreductase|nr:NAD(P)-dependent alcohol dehydrogenase [bacterium]